MDTTAEALRRFSKPEEALDLFLLREGRERQFLAEHPLVKQLGESLRTDGDVPSVEQWLDESLEALNPKVRFDDTELMIAVLFALARSKPDASRAVLQPFADCKAAEVGQISRYARRLLDALDVADGDC